MLQHIDRDEAIRFREHFHKHPELSGQEYETARFIRQHLQDWGIEYKKVGETGTYAWIKGAQDNGRKVLLRADIDALPIEEHTTLAYKSVNPGVMHACGHDIHGAALLAAAKRLAELTDTFSGTVLLAFQQAEEFGHGSQYFIQQGLAKGYDRAFGVHIAPDVPVGSIVLSRREDAASCDFFRLTIKGRKAHTSKPQLGRDALQAGTLLTGEISRLRSRVLPPEEKVIVGIGVFRAGSSYNVVADEAVIEGSFRAYSNDTRERLKEEFVKLAGAVEEIYGVQVFCEFDCFASPLINDEEARDEIAAAAAELLGQDKVKISEQPAFGFAGDDFAEYLKDSKGAYVHLGVADDNPASQAGLHSDKLEPAEEAVVIAADLHLNYALSYLGQVES